MRAELEQHLRDEFPEVFRNGTMRDDGMVFGFQHGDGWFPIIATLLRYAQWRADQAEPGEWRPLILEQVKEKFGGLRFYYSGGDDTFRVAVQFAEHLSYAICEACGRPGNDGVNERGWYQTLCPEHRELADTGVPAYTVLESARPEQHDDFCRSCGANIPPRDGEGTCEACQ